MDDLNKTDRRPFCPECGADLAGADGERLRDDLGSLAEGADASEWDGNQLAELEPDIASMSLVADGCGAYPDGMGADAMRFFGIER